MYMDPDADERTPAIVVDNGSGCIKAGTSAEESPSTTLTSMVGYTIHQGVQNMGIHKDYYIGSEAQTFRGICELRHPIKHGIVEDWDDMQKLWSHLFENELRLIPGDDQDCCGVFCTEAPLVPSDMRERMIEMMFETFEVQRYYVYIQAVLALFANGRTTGVVVDSGDGVTHSVPLFEGYWMPHAIQRVNLAGRELTEYMAKILMQSKVSLTSSAELEIARELKESFCRVAVDYEAESNPDLFHGEDGQQKQYEMPDGLEITINNQQLRCPELMFKPRMNGKEMMGIHELTWKTVMDCAVDVRKPLLNSVVLAGGNTMFPGFQERLQNELQALSTHAPVKVVAQAERSLTVWMGAAILVQMTTFESTWICKDANAARFRSAEVKDPTYEECGKSIVHRLCPRPF